MFAQVILRLSVRMIDTYWDDLDWGDHDPHSGVSLYGISDSSGEESDCVFLFRRGGNEDFQMKGMGGVSRGRYNYQRVDC